VYTKIRLNTKAEHPILFYVHIKISIEQLFCKIVDTNEVCRFKFTDFNILILAIRVTLKALYSESCLFEGNLMLVFFPTINCLKSDRK